MSPYFASLITLPTLISTPGEYRTRCGEQVIIKHDSTRHNFECTGHYVASGIAERWHKSGRILATRETNNDIVMKVDPEALPKEQETGK